MSSYVNFYVKNPINGSFTPLANYSRSSVLYRAFDTAGFSGKSIKDEDGDYYTLPIAATKNKLREIRRNILDDIKENERAIESQEEKIKLVMDANNNLNEKLEVTNDIFVFINDIEEDNEEAKSAIEFIDFLIEIIEQFEYTDNYAGAKDEIIYIGIDCYIRGLDDKLYNS